MRTEIDILENEIVEQYPGVLDILLRDHSTQQNIFWGTNNYRNLGKAYSYNSEIRTELITGDNGNIIMPRVQKDIILQRSRARDMAEVFTPSWICNAQNNLIDNSWFKKENDFNKEIELDNGFRAWEVNTEKIVFPENKTWKDYVQDNRLEIACGEAPYITSRYDTTTGEFIPVHKRVGILDRKLRVINENVDDSGAWLKAAQLAFMSTYAYDWQGDNLILAREALLFTFIENYTQKFGRKPVLRSIKYIAKIISWNVWQMDGIKGVVPLTCSEESNAYKDLFGNKEIDTKKCLGCKNNEIKKHNGIYCLVKDWKKIDKTTGRKGKKIRFIDLLNN